MTCKDLFALGVRLFGIWLITRGTPYLSGFIDGKLYPATEKQQDVAAANLIYAALDFTLAALFLLGTRLIVAWTYDEGPKDISPEVGPAAEVPEH